MKININNNMNEILKKSVNQNKKLSDKQNGRDILLREKANDLEAIFITQIFKAMEKTIPKTDSGDKQNLSTMMFSSVMGKAVAHNGGIGLSDMIFNSLKGKGDISQLSELKNNYLQNPALMNPLGFNEDE